MTSQKLDVVFATCGHMFIVAYIMLLQDKYKNRKNKNKNNSKKKSNFVAISY